MELTRTARVIVRHAVTCPHRKKGPDYRKCNCRKSLLVYDGATRTKEGVLTNRVISAHTRSWERADDARKAWLDEGDPDKIRLKQLEAIEAQQQVRIEDGVALYISDMVSRLGDNNTVAMARSLLGHVDPDTKQVTRPGHLFTWLDKQVPRPVFVADLTSSLVTAWRATWRCMDSTAANRWTIAKGFFNFCEARDWVRESPSRRLKPIKVEKGSRTVPFTDEQYDAILAAIPTYEPDMISSATRQNWQHRVTAFIELMRWSGMDLVDAVQFTTDQIDGDGVLCYRRQKSGILATIPLPERLIVLLRDVPPERDSVDASQPFRRKASSVTWDTQIWAQRLGVVFALAGITEVETDLRKRRPHTKMLRDTFATWHLRHGARLHTVSAMLGHTKTSTTEKHYLPWVPEIKEAHIADARKSLAQIPKPKDAKNVVAITSRG